MLEMNFFREEMLLKENQANGWNHYSRFKNRPLGIKFTENCTHSFQKKTHIQSL